MSETDFLKHFAQLYNIVLKMRKDEDYAINQTQMDRLCQIYRFFLDRADELDGKVEPLRLIPKEENSGVEATFLVFDVHGEKVQEFCRVMSFCSAIGIDTCTDGVCISCTVPNVFIPKSQAKLN